MPAAWDIVDDVLGEILSEYKAAALDAIDVTFHLYKNDYVPVPGSVIGDYDECDFTGYTSADVPAGEWTAVAVTDHVAKTTADTVLSYVYTAGGGATQQVYGYYATNPGGDYLWGERFATTREVNPGDVLELTPELRVQVYPSS